MSPGGEYAELAGLTRRETLANGAKLVIGAGIGAQIMAATGAETAIAKQVRSVAAAAGNKPGYGNAGRRRSDAAARRLRGLRVRQGRDADERRAKTPQHHDGSTVFNAGNGRLTLIRNQELAGLGKSIGKHNAYDRHAKGGVTTIPVRHRRRESSIGSSLVLNGTDNNCNGGRTPWSTWLTCEESTVGKFKGYEKEHGYVFEIPYGRDRARSSRSRSRRWAGSSTRPARSTRGPGSST